MEKQNLKLEEMFRVSMTWDQGSMARKLFMSLVSLVPILKKMMDTWFVLYTMKIPGIAFLHTLETVTSVKLFLCLNTFFVPTNILIIAFSSYYFFFMILVIFKPLIFCLYYKNIYAVPSGVSTGQC